MGPLTLTRIPVVGALGYPESARRVPDTFVAALRPEPGNRYFPHAIAVLVEAEKVGYVAPEIARRYFEPLTSWTGEAVSCPGRRAAGWDRDTSGVEFLLDFSSLPVKPAD